jgi:probable addiction module antidote protein
MSQNGPAASPEQQLIAELNAALRRQDQQAFLRALMPIVKQQGGFAGIARETALNRTALYRMLSSANDAKLSTLLALLPSLGMQLSMKRITEPKTSLEK